MVTFYKLGLSFILGVILFLESCVQGIPISQITDSTSVLAPKSAFQPQESEPSIQTKLKWLIGTHKTSLVIITAINLGVGALIYQSRQHPWTQNFLQVLIVLPWSVWMTYYGDRLAQRAETMDLNRLDIARTYAMKRVAFFSRIADFFWVVFVLSPLANALLQAMTGAPVGGNEIPNWSSGLVKYAMDQWVFLPFYLFLSFFVKASFKRNLFLPFWEQLRQSLKPRLPGFKGLFFSGGLISGWFVSWAASLIFFIPVFIFCPSDMLFIPLSFFNVGAAILFSVILNRDTVPPLFTQKELIHLKALPLQERMEILMNRLRERTDPVVDRFYLKHLEITPKQIHSLLRQSS